MLGKTLIEAWQIIRSGDAVSENILSNGEKPIANKALWILRDALTAYSGEGRFCEEKSDLLCLCYSVSKKDIIRKVLSNKDFDLKLLIQDTMASSACGGCRIPILELINKTRIEHGLIKGLDHSKSRFDEKGNWIKIAGMYPGPLLIKLEELKNRWMKREQIENQFTIDFIDIEGFHLTVKINSTNEKTINGLLQALGDYFKSELGILFFLNS
jgi:bacterioferritin-associated ferredoxin